MRGEPRWIAAVRCSLREHRLLEGCRTLLVGVSGGADSVALLTALRRICGDGPPKLIAAHLDHRIRGRVAERDAAFVRRFARRIGVACVVGRRDVPAIARRRGLSLEAAARVARLEWFATVARRVGADRVALAHTRDDQAETVLLRLLRGAGAEGLSAMSRDTVVQGLRIVRPLLEVSREEVREGLTAEGLPWREDASNRDLRHVRNRIRFRLLPAVEREVARNVRVTLARAAEILAAEDALLAVLTRRAMRRRLKRRQLIVEGWGRMPLAIQRRVVRLWLRSVGVPDSALTWAVTESVRGIASTGGDQRLTLAGGWRISVESGRLRALRAQTDRRCCTGWRAVRFRLPGVVRPAGANFELEAVADRGWRTVGEHGIGRLPATAWIARGTGREVLTVRRWRPGDAYRPLGAPGTAKLSDVFTNEKTPREVRARWPVVLQGREIIWLPGYRVAEAAKVKHPRAPSWRLTLRRRLERQGEATIVGDCGRKSGRERNS
ncbi:MAG: tRNA lysidine(34) synthetase TilS [Kiritimatiellae bacterium]|nr:tRNA lysidine(34) synthetase TilS [Kiritimatiellia bacterium]